MKKTLVLFGSGKIGSMAIKEVELDQYDEVIYCDNDSSKWGEKVNGCSVIGCEDLKGLCQENEVKILITCGMWREIYAQCCKLGLQEQLKGIYEQRFHRISKYEDVCKINVYGMDNFEAYMHDLFGDKKGFYIDIGAYDPFLYSNTAWAADIGWKGINIEPNPDAVSLFQHFRSDAINLNIGISNKEGIYKYYMNTVDPINTFSEEYAVNKHFLGTRVVDIPVRRLDSVLEEYGITEIDFMDVDVERWDLEVLESNNWSLYRPKIVMCEQVSDVHGYMDVEELMQTDVYRFMKEQKYKLVNKYGRNAMYMDCLNS